MDQITLRLDEGVLASVEEEAEGSDTTRTEYLRDVVESLHEGKRIRDRRAFTDKKWYSLPPSSVDIGKSF